VICLDLYSQDIQFRNNVCLIYLKKTAILYAILYKS